MHRQPSQVLLGLVYSLGWQDQTCDKAQRCTAALYEQPCKVTHSSSQACSAAPYNLWNVAQAFVPVGASGEPFAGWHRFNDCCRARAEVFVESQFAATQRSWVHLRKNRPGAPLCDSIDGAILCLCPVHLDILATTWCTVLVPMLYGSDTLAHLKWHGDANWLQHS